MTNIEKMKKMLCDTIMDMSDELFFEFLSDEENSNCSYYPQEALFSCDKCYQMYGECQNKKNSDTVDSEFDYGICQNRFYEFGHKESDKE